MFAARGKGDPLVGTRIDEYRLEALLGSGGMARVYRAMDVNLNRAVAIKVIDTPYQSDAEYGRRFKHEAQAIAQLEHPHIVRLYRYGQSGELFYMAMQFIRGVNLNELLQIYQRAGQTVVPAEAARIIREVGEALDFAHSMGVIHRDVKSSNIIINQQGRVVLVDFGLAMLADQSPGGDALGSPHYLAPEQAVANGRITPQTDLYSLGIILYEMLTGQRPYSAPDPYALAQKHVHEPPPAPTALRPEISPAVEKVMLKVLSKNPRSRYQSGQALSDALELALLEEPFPIGIPAPLLVELVQQRLEIGPATAEAPPAKPAPASAEGSIPTSTKLSWDERQRRASPAGPTEPAKGAAAAVPDMKRSAPRRKKSILTTPAVLGLLIVLLLCLGASLLAAANNLRLARRAPAPTVAAIFIPGSGGELPFPGETSSPGQTASLPETTPTDFLPVQGVALTPAGTDFIPNTGVEPESATSTSIVIIPGPTSTTAPQVTVIVVTNPAPLPTVAVTNPPPPTSPPPPTQTTAPPPAPTQQPSPTTAPPTPTYTHIPPTATHTPVPPTATSPPPTQPVMPQISRLSIQRRGEDQGWMVIINRGNNDVPLATFRIDSRKGSLSASSWGVDRLPPGGCLLARREDRRNKGEGLPDGVACGQVGPTAWVSNPDSGIFKEAIAISYDGQQIASCAKDERSCAVVLP